MSIQNVIITNILPTGTTFAATQTSPSRAVFVPAHLAEPAGVVVGEEVRATLVPNTMHPERTPWLAIKLETLAPLAPAPVSNKPSTEGRVLGILREGGEWTVGDMATHLGVDPSEVSEALEALYNKDLCSKYQLWRKRSDAEPDSEWFTCFPDEVDFVAGEED
jgi:DNA-binding transcriptional ArsR family regulator